MYSRLGIVAFLSVLLLAISSRCAFWDHVDAYEAGGSSSARGKHVHRVEDASNLGTSPEYCHERMRPSKRLRGDEDQVLVNGPLPVFREKHEKMHQEYSELMAELHAVGTYLTRPLLKDSVTSETDLYNSLKRHLSGWTIGMTNQLIVPLDVRVSALALHLKTSLHEMRVHEPKSLPIFREAVARDHSLAKLKLMLWTERVIFWTLTYLYDFQKITKEQLRHLLCDQRTLELIGCHIHDVYQFSSPQKFWPSIEFFSQDPALAHLHKLLRVFQRGDRASLVHTVLLKTCQSFQHHDRLRLNLIHPKFHEVVDTTGEEFLMAILKDGSHRMPSETNTILQGVQNAREYSARVDGPASFSLDSTCAETPGSNKANNDKASPYKTAIEMTESLLLFYIKYSIAQLGAEDLEEQFRIETIYRQRMLSKSPHGDEKAAILLFDPNHGTCQARAPEWKLRVEPSARERHAPDPNQRTDLTSPNPTRERLLIWTLNID